ncbi:restriction endonuclease subunit S [Lactococcus lactis]|uniref:restriction endonuclease subunit S n=1 Tax=Lactococcus lactis TaxID=1358 RepID=UPI003342C89A
MDASLNEKLRSVEWGEYKIEDLFIVKTSKGYDAGKLNFISKSKETFEFIGRTQSDYGVQGYVLKLDSEPNDSGCISVSQIGAVHAQLRNKKWYSSQNIFILKPKIDKLINQWLIVAINKALSNFGGYSSYPTLSTLKKLTILLPINNEQIDFDFMESFIAELEAERIAELSAYLKVSGMDNYELSDEELKALRDYDSMEWREYKLGELFEVKTYKKRFDANKVTLVSKGGSPYVVRKSTENGIKGFISEDDSYLNEGNTISFGQDTATSFYQEQPYFTGDKIKILKAKFNGFNKDNAQFFVSAITRSFSKFSWGSSSYSVDIISNQKLALPVLNNEIAIKYIEVISKAISKLTIKDVVQYTNERIETTKEVVTSHNSNY